jgi:hypothetical protein
MPEDLHWFMWEAYTTWITGFLLLVLVYWVGAASFLIDPAKAVLTPLQASGIGAAVLVAGWLVYDGLCRSPLGRDDRALGAVWFAVLVGAAWGLCQVFSARGAYLHVGAIIGSAMVGNVFFVIIPNQRKVVAALKAGEVPDPALGKAAKARSLHNNYMTLPVLFVMISHHYAMTFGAERPWLVLALLGLTGVAVRHVFNLRHRGQPLGRAILVAAVLALAPAVLTPLLLWRLPTDFLPLLMGDYLVLHFALYGALTLAGLGWAGNRVPRARGMALALGIVLVTAWALLAVGVPVDRYVFNAHPEAVRLPIIAALCAGTLPYFLADEWFTRSPAAAPGAYFLTKLCFLLSLVAAIALNPQRLFFLAIIVPAILLLFVVYGLFSRWAGRASGHPAVAAVANALAFGAFIAVTFPLVA